MASVFVSHSSLDKPFVRRVERALRQNGVNVWLDERQIKVGHKISSRIQDGIDNSDYFLMSFPAMRSSQPGSTRSLIRHTSKRSRVGGTASYRSCSMTSRFRQGFADISMLIFGHHSRRELKNFLRYLKSTRTTPPHFLTQGVTS